MSPRRMQDPVVRLMSHVKKAENGCWIWCSVVGSNGYGRVWLAGTRVSAHVAMYTVVKGPVPSGLQIDHKCHSDDLSCRGGPACLHRRCVNPDHLEAVTPLVNAQRAVARITHCPKNHEYAPENTGGRRVCRECGRKSTRESRARRPNRIRDRRTTRSRWLSEQANSEDPLMTNSDVAAYLGLKPATWRNMISDGATPPPDDPDNDRCTTYRRNAWRKSTIDAWKAQRPGQGKRPNLEATRAARTSVESEAIRQALSGRSLSGLELNRSLAAKLQVSTSQAYLVMRRGIESGLLLRSQGRYATYQLFDAHPEETP